MVSERPSHLEPQRDHTTVIVGTSVGGVRAAQALRSNGYEGRIVLVGEEKTPPYDKPPLSKELLTGAEVGPALWLLRDGEAEYSRLELRLGERAEALDPAGRLLYLASGERLAYDHLVVAAGASARPSPWPDTKGVHLLRTLEDSKSLRADLLSAGRVAVVGAGFIGAEVASSARALGLEVSLVDPLPLPMSRAVGEQAGRVLAELHKRSGVDTRFGVGVDSLEGCPGGYLIQLSDGATIEAPVVVLGIGTALNDSWLRSSGLGLEDGILCDEHCRAVGAEEVYGVGDIARWHHRRHGQRVRVEHWTNAVEQAACVAHNIAHPQELQAHEPVEYVWTDQYDWNIQIAGRPQEASSSTAVGEPGADRRFAFLHEGDSGVLVGAMAVNWPRGLLECRRMLAAGVTFAESVDRLRSIHS